MKILGIETSCDETAASVVEVAPDKSHVTLLSSVTATSLNLHAKTGGIIPEVAARNQIKDIIPVIYEALNEAECLEHSAKSNKTYPTLSTLSSTPAVDQIAVTYGPGLIGSLLVGVETAKTLSYIWNKPLIPVNHLFGHIYANWIMADGVWPIANSKSNHTQYAISNKLSSLPTFPAIGLIVSGGHTDLVLTKSHKDIIWLGGTRDDAAGECFDKCARLIGYDYPGGPKIAELATKGDPNAFSFPRPMIGDRSFEFSFSGLKTAFLNKTKEHFAVLRTSDEKIGWNQIMLEKHISDAERQTLYNLCASLQEAIVDVLVKKTLQAAEKYHAASIILGGGVSANELLTKTLSETLHTKYKMLHAEIFVPKKSLCTDNGAMIATAAFFQGKDTDWNDISANPELYFD